MAPPPLAPCVLLVDDNADNREMYRQYLEWDGFRVVLATDGLQALDQAAQVMPTVIVTDLAMPKLNGWDMVGQLKGDPRTRHVPVLAVSAHALVGEAKRARAAGCDGYLSKPCLPAPTLHEPGNIEDHRYVLLLGCAATRARLCLRRLCDRGT